YKMELATGSPSEASEANEVDRKISELMTRLRERGQRVTAQRIAIAKLVLEKIKEHPSFTTILKEARRRIPGVSTSTVYNTLQLLEDMGFLQSFSVKGATHYDSPHSHVNIVCMDTGEIKDYEDKTNIVLELGKITGVRVKNVIIYGYCGERLGD
ncbi:MAG: Fur family transcriptional regulator, partial [Pyrodictiaceae archaeon]